MLHLIEGFDSLEEMKLNGWASSTATVGFAKGRTFGRSLEMKSEGRGLFLSTYMLSRMFSQGNFGIAVNLVASENSFSVIFFADSHERCHVAFLDDGSVRVYRSGIEIGKTGQNNFDKTIWNYFEIIFNDHTMSVVLNGRVLVNIRNVFVSFDRFAFSVPDDQPVGVRIDDLCFDDDPTIKGSMAVLGSLPYIPSQIHGIRLKGGEIKIVNPDTGNPWTFRDFNKKDGVRILVSENRNSVPAQHSTIT